METNFKKPETMLDAIGYEVNYMKEMNRIGTYNSYRAAGNSFRRYLHSRLLRDIHIKHLDAKMLIDYQSWMWQQGVSRNSTSCYMRSLRAIYNRHCINAAPDLFSQIYTGIASTRKRAIGQEDINQLIALDIQKALTLQMGTSRPTVLSKKVRRMQQTRDFFIFCFCSRGLTFVDLAFLRFGDIACGTLVYRRKKTGQEIKVHIEPIMMKIIDRRQTDGHHGAGDFLFPIIAGHMSDKRRHLPYTTQIYLAYRNALNAYNRDLHELSQLMQSKHRLTSYVSRHTWATQAYRHQVPLPIISKALGHTSVQTTQIYIESFSDQEIDIANRQLLSLYF